VPELSLRGRTALVTGAGRNIGRGIALAFAEAGADVAVNVRANAEEAERVVADARGCGVRAHAVVGDIGSPDGAARVVDDAVDALGAIDVLVCSASVRPTLDFLAITPERWDELLRTNLSSMFYLSRLVLPSMTRRGFGRVIGIGGPDADFGVPSRAYNLAAKEGMVGLVKAIAVEFGAGGVTANVVTPYLIDTTRDLSQYPSWPPSEEFLRGHLSVPRLGTVEDVASVCLFLASERSSFITGETIHVSGFPRLSRGP
jgi:3-oxoacyl-[acyl-carrier protein] reductase